MARNRVIYQSEALYVSEDASSRAAAGHEQLQRVQSANYSFNVNRTDINQFGQMSRIDSLILENPTVSFDLSYYLGDGFNEQALGFSVKQNALADAGFASGHMVGTSGKNFYIFTVPEGNDAISAQNATDASCIALGNAYLTDYTLDASVGSIPTVTASFEAANISSFQDSLSGTLNGDISGIISPAIKQSDGEIFNETQFNIDGLTGQVDSTTPTALRAGDVKVTFSSAAANENDGPIVFITGTSVEAGDGAHIQSASLSVPLSRTPLERLGNRFPFARTVDFPVNATLSVSAIVNEVTAFNLADMITGENSNGIDITVDFQNDSNTTKFGYQLKGAQLDSESFSSSIGSNKTVDLSFSCPIGAVDDTSKNILASGTYGTVPFAT